MDAKMLTFELDLKIGLEILNSLETINIPEDDESAQKYALVLIQFIYFIANKQENIEDKIHLFKQAVALYLVYCRVYYNISYIISKMSNLYTFEDLIKMGVKVYGKNIYISKFVNIYTPQNLILHDNIRVDDFTVISCKGVIEIFN